MSNESQGPFIKRISTNVRGVADVELSPCTILVGKCGSGKNSLIDAASLGLVGQAWTKGLGKKASTLMKLAPVDDNELYSNLVLSSGEVCSWSTKGTDKTTARKIAGSNGLEFPAGIFVFDATESLLFGDAKKLQKAILGATDAKVKLHEVHKDLAESLHPTLRKVLTKGGGLDAWEKTEDAPHGLTPAQSTAALDWISSRKRAVNKEIKVLDVGDDEAVPLSEAEKGELEGLRALHRKLSLEPGDPEDLNAKADQAEKRVGELQARMLEISPMGSQGIENLEGQVETLKMISKTQKYLIAKISEGMAQGNGYSGETYTCPCCGTKELMSIDLQHRFDMIDGKVKELEDKLFEQKAARGEWDRLQEEKTQLSKEVSRLRRKASRASGPPDEDDVAAMSRFKSLDERHKRSQQEVANAALLPELRREIDELNAVREVIEVKLGEIVEGAAAVVEKRLNRFLPKNFRAQIKISGRKKDGVTIEASLDKGHHRDFRALSGGQQATLNAAIASATIPNEAPPVRLLVVNDLLMDTTTMRNLMKMTAKAAAQDGGFTQAIFCAVSWTGKAPDGWSMINITREKGAEVSEYNQT